MAKRKLPVLQPPPPSQSPDEGPERPPWQWIGFGTVAIFVAWLPLAWLAERVSRAAVARVLAGEPLSGEDAARTVAALDAAGRARLGVAMVVPNLAALGLAAFAGGWLVGRYGAGAGAREATLAG